MRERERERERERGQTNICFVRWENNYLRKERYQDKNFVDDFKNKIFPE